MGIGDELVHELTFWPEWEQRFEAEYDQYITPQNMMVKRAVVKSDAGSVNSDKEQAKKCWQWVADNIKYKLSEKWKTPEETIFSATGDCEDVTFLIASMLARLGIDNSRIVVGYLEKEGYKPELHTWNEVNGMVIDATGEPQDIPNLEYDKEFSFTVAVNAQ
jgi:transglutaminase-like putative cysteine protease